MSINVNHLFSPFRGFPLFPSFFPLASIMLLFLREIFCTYLMMSFTLALSLPAGDGGEDTSSPCSQKCSSIKNSSASGVQYSLEVSLPTYNPGWPTEGVCHYTYIHYIYIYIYLCIFVFCMNFNIQLLKVFPACMHV